MLASQLFNAVAWRKGDHWRLSENERNELGVAAMRASKALPQIPADKLGKWGAVAGLGIAVVGIVQPRVERDRVQQINPALQPPAERLSPDLQRLVDAGVEIQYLTPDQYAAMMREQNGEVPSYPTLATTDETLLDRVIETAEGVDQATLAQHARAAGRLEG